MTLDESTMARVSARSQGALVDVEVSIVSLLGGSRLERCLAALPAACGGLSWKVSLVDNSRSGLELGGAADLLPELTVIRSLGRRGFAANQNLVLGRLVAEHRARYALILNDDTELSPDSVRTLVRWADERPRTGAVGPAIPGSATSMFAWPTPASRVLSSLFPRKLLRPQGKDGWLTGACILARTEALAEVGLFDPRYFLYFEDIDLCRRITDAGWHTEYCPGATIVHHLSQTTTRTSTAIQAQEQMLRSQYLYCRKHHGRLTATALEWFGKCALIVRTGKFGLLSLIGRTESGTMRLLCGLIRYRPTRPTQFEIEARERAA